MLDTEYNEAEIKELFMEDGRKEARDEGIKAFILDKLEDNIAKDIMWIASRCQFGISM